MCVLLMTQEIIFTPSLLVFCVCVCPGVEGGAVKVTGAKGCAPPHDYKVKHTLLKSHMH